MGKIKSKMIKRTAQSILKDVEFAESFKENKRILGKTMPSKKVKNQLAGHLAKLKKLEKQNQPIIK